MNKKLALASLACAFLALPLVFSSCSKDTPTPRTAEDERNNKGHEDPVTAELVLRAGTLKPGVTFSENTTYDDVIFSESEVQRITIHNEIDEEHGHSHSHAAGEAHGHDHHHATGSAGEDTFEVESTGKTPGRVYALEITYRNAAGEPMNDQLISPDQLDRHQHFLRQVLTSTESGYTYVDRNAPHLLLYKYAYADVFGGEKNPVGFRGLLSFDKPTDSSEAEVQMHIVLAHFYGTKFVGSTGTRVNPYYLPSVNAATDISLEVFFHINEAHNH